jgi:hypothetical protein
MKTSTERKWLTMASVVAILTTMMYTSSALAVDCTSPGVPAGCKPKPPTTTHPKMLDKTIQQQ